jgi:quercetin dioxygenase-like cupin family protein
VTNDRYETATIADMSDSHGWSPIRKRFGIQSFGINAWTAAAGDRVIPEHDEVPSGHEEIYLVVSGRATITVDGEEVDAPAGTIVFVRDPASQRGATAREDGTTVVAVGGRPGDVYHPRSWELQVPALFDQGDHEKAKQVLTGALDHYEDKAGILYNLACAEALTGDVDGAIGHLRAAVEGNASFAEYARDDPDFESIRDDPRFGEITAS